MEKPHKLYIGGTGRAGTTFLVLILKTLGVDDNSPDWKYDSDAELPRIPKGESGGEVGEHTPEKDIPYLVKCPGYITKIDGIVQKHHVDYFIIPIRNYKDAAKSRENIGGGKPGGLWSATNAKEQREFYYEIMAEYLYKMTVYDVPTIFINFERMISDDKYLYEKIKPVLRESITYENYKEVYDRATEHQTCGK
tara:strand:+ start:647 stop:1228 length:582 start_codon:yes stop_codon:yes gene_type:complete